MATLTINTTTQDAARVAAAFGARLNLGRDANMTEVKQQTVQFLREVVQGYEQQEAAKAAIAAVTIIDPT
jgi:hypothetical protein